MNAETHFAQLEKELKPHVDMMGKAADAVLDQDISRYPIFVLHQEGVNLGIPVLGREAAGTKWSINLSTLEEMVTKKIVRMERVDPFRQVYKDPQEFLCLFVLDDSDATFIFIPRIK